MKTRMTGMMMIEQQLYKMFEEISRSYVAAAFRQASRLGRFMPSRNCHQGPERSRRA